MDAICMCGRSSIYCDYDDDCPRFKTKKRLDMNTYCFNYKVPLPPNSGMPLGTTDFTIKNIKLVAEDIFSAVDSFRQLYKDDQFEVISIHFEI